ncbi:MAG: diacylglycerol kinase [Salinisphaeraceae bacterium]|nr:diacylglycerol kinase [Salinisphaeraceae bacterium]
MFEPPSGDPREKVTGLAHIVAAGRYSLNGFRDLLGELAFRHELLGFMLGLGVLILLGVPGWQTGLFCLLFLLLAAVESLNTAIERIVDRVSPEVSDMARQSKDMGSFAVFCLLCANIGFFAWAVWRQLAG